MIRVSSEEKRMGISPSTVLEMLENGKSPETIARELGVPVEEVYGVIKILESMGYIEEVKFGSSACQTCPLKNICPGSCIRKDGKVLVGFTIKGLNKSSKR